MVFAYVERSNIEKYSARHKSCRELQDYIKLTGKRVSHVVYLEVLVKKITPNALREKPLVMKPISRMKPNLRKFSALQDVNRNPLFMKLLKPEGATFYVRSGEEQVRYPQHLMINLNAEQKRIMSACASMCTTNLKSPQAVVIQGPPGTGKSTTITAMILQIIFRWKHQFPNQQTPRILITGIEGCVIFGLENSAFILFFSSIQCCR